MANNRAGSTTFKFCLTLASLPLLGIGGIKAALAEPITSDSTTNTNVTPDGNIFEITGGQVSADGQNLFHSFSEFGLSSEQVANFISNPNIENILSRITGGNLSVIDGLLQVSGGDSNLFLMNPAGILFGSNARLDLPASFTATTATGIGFNEQWFNATGRNDYAALVGIPNLFDFNTLTPGAIINAGKLEVNPQQNITLLGGTVISTGQLIAEDGQVTIATVPGNNLVRFSQPGHALSLEVSPSSSPSITTLSLPQLLTGGNAEHASGLTINNNGEVVLTGSQVTVESGDVAVRGLNSGTALLSAEQNLKLVESQLQTTGDMQLRAGNTFLARDSTANPLLAHSGGDLLVEGKNQIDILTLNHPEEISWQSGGNLSLVSDGLISGDAHFRSGGNFSVLNLSGQPGNYVSFFDPVITVGADYNIGNYTGAALKVTAGGTITGGNIIITQPDDPATVPANDPDFVTLTTTPALILRSGGDIQLGSVDTSTDVSGIGDAGPVILEAMGDIKLLNEIAAEGGITGDGGDINLTATNGNIDIQIQAGGRGINTRGLNGGDINLTAGGTISFLDAISEGSITDNVGTGGNINISAGADVISDDIQSRGSGGAGNITVTSSNGIIDNRPAGLGQEGSIASCTRTAAAFCAGGNVGDIILNAPKGSIFLGGSDISNSNGTNTLRGNNIILNSPNINLTKDQPITSLGDITINGDLNTAGLDLNLAGNLRLGGNVGINTQGGDILLDGTVDGTTAFNENLNLNSGGGVTTINGAIGSNTSLNTLSTDAGGMTIITNNNLNARRLEFNDPVSFQLNPNLPPQVTLTADETVFGSTVTGLGIDLVLQPSAIGSNFSLTSATTPDFVDGFNSITIGRADGTGQIDIDGEVSFSDPVTIRSPLGTINVNENLRGLADASVTLEAATTNLNADIATEGQNINLDSNLLLGDDVELNSNGGTITFNGTVDGNQNLTVNSGTGVTVFNNNVGETTSLNTINTDPGGTTIVNGNLTANRLNFDDPITVNNSLLTATEIDLGSTVNANGNLSLNAPTIKLNDEVRTNEGEDINFNGNVELEEDISLNGGNINFNGNINGDQNLVITSFGGGTTTFNGDVGNVSVLNTLSADPAGNTVLGNNSNLSAQFLDFKGTLQVLSDSTLAANQIDFGANVTGPGSNLVLKPLTLNQNVAIAGVDNNTAALDLTAAELAQLQDGFASLTIGSSAGTGDITVNASQFSDPVTIKNGGLITINGTVTGTDDASITLNSAEIALNANLATNNADINLENNVLIGNNLTLSSGGGNITFNGTVDSTNNQNLTVNNGGGVTTFNGAVGSNNPLNLLRTEGGGITRVNSSLATNILDFNNNALELGVVNSTLRAAQMNLGTTVSGSGDLNLQALQPDGNLNLLGLTTFANGFSSITIGQEQGSGVISLGGDFTFNDPVSILSPKKSGSIVVNGTLAGSGDASLNLRTRQNITTENITNAGAPITLTSENGGITSGNITSTLGSGGITVSAEDDVVTGDITSNGSAITLTSDDGGITSGNIDSSLRTSGIVVGGIVRGNVTVSAEDDVITGDITSNGSDITLISEDGNLQAGNLNSSSDSNGGNIRAFANDGVVTLGNLNSSGVSDGGNIEVEAEIAITTGEIDSSATEGNGGDVSLDPDNDIEVTFINAQGGTNGTGGEVDIETRRFFRASGTFTDQTGAVASISTAGGTGGGDITIRHGGGFRDVPFTVGANYNGRNGTAGVISTGSGSANQIIPGEYPFLFEKSGIGDMRLLTLPAREPDPDVTRPDSNLPAEENFTLEESTTEPIDPPGQSEAVAIDPFFDDFDSYFTRQFESYLGLDKVKIRTLKQVRERLEQLEEIPGVKSALIYARFVPNQNPLQEQSNQDNNQLELLLVTSSREMIHKRVGVTRSQVLGIADKFRLTVTNARDKDGYLQPSQQLYQWLLAPLEKELQAQGIDNLVFLLDSGLRSVPVAALHDGKQFLVEQYSVSLMPSFSLTNTGYHDIKESQILAMGADRFVNNKPLPAVPVELKVITQRLWQGKSFLNNTFTLQNLKAQRAAKSFGIIHLATHADFQAGDPSRSYIQLWDRKLSLDELPKLGLDKPTVDLLVLSACRTALGNEEAELGFAGLAVQAGVKSSLGSFWYVSDEGTLALMTEFYDQLDMTITKAEALRQAQLAMLKGQVKLERAQLLTPRENIVLPRELSNLEFTDMTHPYYWAGFSLVGNSW